MRRRALLASLSVSLTSITGCVDDIGLIGGGNGVVLYEELPEDDRRFMDAAKSHHSLQWIPQEGERVYLESTDDGYVEAEDPLLSDDLSQRGLDILHGRKFLSLEDDHYGIVTSLGHGPSGWLIEVDDIDACAGESWKIDTFDGDERLILEAAIEAGEVFFAKTEFEAVSNADVFVDIGQLDFEEKDIAFGEDCIISDGETYQVNPAREYNVHYVGYHLEPIDDED